MIACTIKTLCNKHLEKGQPIDGISTINAQAFMFEKAKSCTITQTVLNKMRYAEVELLSHQAEDTRDVEQFLTALKFAPTLITTTHAKN